MEEWIILPEHRWHRVSNYGNVQYLADGEWRPKKLKLIQKGKLKSTRYLGFNIPVEGYTASGHRRSKTLKLHQVVARLFIGPRPEGMQVMHKDQNELNCRWDNLEYGTLSDNIKSWHRARNAGAT
jgi:hypothetical protein